MRWNPVPFVGGAYTDDSVDYSAQECLNFIPEVGPDGARSPAMLRQAPGRFNCGAIGDGPHRGARECEGALLIVSGTDLCHVKADRSWKAVGTIPGTSRCKIAHNSVGEALIVNGTDGYLYNYLTETFTRVTDTSFLGACDVDYLAHYFVTIAASRRRWQHSSLDDGAEWSALSTYNAEADPDAMIGLVADHGQLLVFGRKTAEWFANEPLSAVEAFQNTRSTVPRGCIAPHSICRLDNTIFWLADDGAVYKLAGQTQPVRISTPAIEQDIARSTQHTAFAFTYEDRGHAIYYLTFQDGHTWGYDVSTGLWHRAASFGLDRLRLNTLFKWDGRWYGGSYNSGDVYTLDWDYAFDDGDPIIRTRRTPPAHDHGSRRVMAGVQAHWSVRESAEPDIVPFWEAIVITPAMPDLAINDNVYETYTQTGATGAVTWSLSSGALPTGLALADPDNTTVSASGAPTTDGTFTFTLRCTENSSGHYGEIVESVVVSPVYVSFATSEVDLTRIGYGKFNQLSGVLTELATVDRDGHHAIGNGPCVINGRLVGRVEYDNVNGALAQESGLFLLEYDGTATLDILDQWQYSTALYHDYLDHVAYDANTVAVVLFDGVGSDTFLCAVSVSGNSLASEGTPLEIDSSTGNHYSLVMHGTTLIALDFHATEANRSLRAYTFDGSTWTLAGTYGGTLTGSFGTIISPMVSNTTHLFLSNGMIFTYSAGTFALVTTATLVGIGGVVGVFEYGGDTVVVYQDGTTALKAFVFDGATATLDDTLTQTVVAGSRGMALSNYAGTLIIPGTTAGVDANSGHFLYNGALARVSTVELTGGATYATIKEIAKLEEA